MDVRISNVITAIRGAIRGVSIVLFGDGTSSDERAAIASAVIGASGVAKGRQVNLFTEGWSAITGTTRVPRYQFGITFVWTDNDGNDHQCQQTLIFPDAILELGIDEITARVQDWLIEIARNNCGVDN